MGLRKRGKDESEKARERASIREAAQTGKIEQQAVAQKQKDRSRTENKLFDVETARRRIKQGLLGYKEKYVRWKDSDTGEVQEGWKKQSTRKKSLCNEEGAGVFMDEANSFLNHNTISTYLPAKTIERKCKGTLKPIYKQIVFNHHKFSIQSTSDAGDIISLIRNPMIDAMNKSRGGRLIKNQEQIRVEKESISHDGSEDEDDQNFGGLF